jgi:hypothetical protein
MGLGFVSGLIAGIVGLPEIFAMPVILIGALTTNFFVFKWAAGKIYNS